MSDTLWTSIIGCVSASIASFLTWIFSRRKQQADTDNTVINGLKEALDIYKDISDDNKARIDENQKRLKEVLDENLQLIRDLTKLQARVDILMRYNCMRANCKNRITNSEEACKDD